MNFPDPRGRRADDASPETDPGSSDVAVGDLALLYAAITARLELLVCDDFLATCADRRDEPMARIRSGVLECVAALDQLHSTLAHEVERRRLLEGVAREAQAALARARVQLVGTQADEQRARHVALHDHLTALPNGTFFREQLDHALAHADRRHRTLAVLYLDLDAFKPINDAHGHAVGDELLRIVATRLSRALRSGDTVGRLGGDEFACTLTGTLSQTQLSQMACKLLDSVSAPLKIGDLRLSVRPSIGIAVCPADGETGETLLRRADTAMYRAKREKCGYAFFDTHVDLSARQVG